MEQQNIPSYTLTDDLQRFGQWIDETLGTELHRVLEFLTQLGTYIHKFIFEKYSLTPLEQSLRSLLIIGLIFLVFGSIAIIRTYAEERQKLKSKSE